MTRPAIATLGRAVRVASARLRFLAVFAVASLVVGGWETLRAHWDRLTAGPGAAAAVSSDTEYFCPMDPGVLSDWPSRCPVCNMTLVRRAKGDVAPLPDGVVARMQLSPYRLWLGGIRTAAAEYAPLARLIEAPGTVERLGPTRVVAELFADELRWLRPVGDAEISAIGPRDGSAAPGVPATIREVPDGIGASANVAIEAEDGVFRVGDRVLVRLRAPADRLPPFRDQPDTPPPLAEGEPRRIFACMEHRDVTRDAPGRCPRENTELMATELRDNQRLRWWCPMHPEVTADRPGATCEPCGGMVLVPRVVSYRLPGTVLAVPASAVIDDGSRTVVYVERGAGMFDGTAVTLGPRCGEFYPVVAGLEPGDRVAAQGAFLLDAETRLNPSLAAGYFGAAGQTAAARPKTATVSIGDALAGLDEADRVLATLQATCPVTGKPLGSMGRPPRVEVGGRPVFLCCAGCSPALEADPEKYLARIPADAGPKARP